MDVSVTIISKGAVGKTTNYRGGAIPRGYLPEDGSEVDKVFYGRLYDVIGDRFGPSTDPSKFKLPDTRGKDTIGSGQGAGLTNRIAVSSGGEEAHPLTVNEMPSHNHGGGNHAHSANLSRVNGKMLVDVVGGTEIAASNRNTNPSGVIITTQGGGNAHNNMQPFTVARKLLKY